MMKKVANTLTRRHFSADAGGSGGGIGERSGGSGAVKYTPCSRLDLHACNDDDGLDEIAVVSNADPGAVKYGSGSCITANGPRVVPGIITSERCGRSLVSTDRLSASGTRINMSSPATAYLGKSTDNVKGKSVSRQSLLEMVSTRLTVGGGNVNAGRMVGGVSGISGSSGAYRNSRFSRDSVAYVNRAHVSSDLDVSWNKVPSNARVFGAGASAAAIPGVGTGGPGHGVMTLTASTMGPMVTSTRRPEVRDPRNKIDNKWETTMTNASGGERSGCKWTFVFDPSGRLISAYWSMVVSVAFLYNFWALIYRFAFQEITKKTLTVWFFLDYMADFLYILDVAFHFRTGYLEDGVLQTDSIKLRQHYVNSTMFYVDCLCLLPLDFLYLSIGFNSILRSFRLLKIYRFWAFLDRTERHTNYPNVFRALSLIHYLLVIFHWNACLCHIISQNGGFGSRTWAYNTGTITGVEADNSEDVMKEYLQAYYWSTLTLTTIGQLPRPRTKGEYVFVVIEIIFALLLFATVLGHVANIVTNVSAARKEFQAKLDGVKTYMRLRRVSQHLQVKVIKWFDYLWMTQKSSDEEKAVSCLPDKLKAEIAIHVHLDTLKRVEIFQNTEAGFLCELVLRLRPVLFSPGDYICRKGEVGKEMYIVNRGKLQVVADNGKTVLATLRAGSYFGEISILNMGTAGNRRTASVRSVGYSDLFCLSKKDMWDVLKEYPAARVRLEAIASKRLEKYKKAPLEKIALGRSQSSPGLVESMGRVPLEEMCMPGARQQASPSEYSSDRRNMESPLTAASTTSNASDDVVSFTGLVTGSGGGGQTVHASHLAVTQLQQQQQQGRSMMMMSTGSSDKQPHHFSQLGTRSSSPFLQQQQQQQHHHLHHVTPQPLIPGGQTFYGHHQVQVPTVSGILAPPPYHTGSTNVQGMFTSRLTPSTFVAPNVVASSESSPHELMAEIKRLRERLVGLETENASMSLKLSQQQWEVEHRLAEIEMHICGGAASGASSNDDNERNKESII